MAETTAFSHGFLYGDDWGVTFYGPPDDGHWNDFLSVSDRYVGPIFEAVLKLSRDSTGTFKGPKLAMERNEGIGWADANEKCEVAAADVRELVVSLSALSSSDIGNGVTWVSADDCIDCARTICEFLEKLLIRGATIYIEDD